MGKFNWGELMHRLSNNSICSLHPAGCWRRGAGRQRGCCWVLPHHLCTILMFPGGAPGVLASLDGWEEPGGGVGSLALLAPLPSGI